MIPIDQNDDSDWFSWISMFLNLVSDYFSLMNEVVHTSPTIGSNVEEVIWKNIHFLMWDIGGQETLRSAWNTYYSNAQVSTATSNTV